MPIVVNIPGTENIKCKCCKSWLEHWKKHSKSDPGLCRSCRKEEATVGGHVNRFMNFRGRAFIVPMCNACNSAKEKMDSFLVTQQELIPVEACFEKLSDISDTNDADTEFSSDN